MGGCMGASEFGIRSGDRDAARTQVSNCTKPGAPGRIFALIEAPRPSVAALRSWTPGNESGPEIRQRENRSNVAAVRVHFKETELAMILEPKDNPLIVWRVRTHESGDVSTLVMSQAERMCSVGTNGHDVW